MSVQQTQWYSQADDSHKVDIILALIYWDYKYMDSRPEPISASVKISILFPLAEKNKLLVFSPGEMIKFGAKLPKSHTYALLRADSLTVTDAYLI